MVQATAAGGGTIKPVQQLEAVTVRFAGDSGDGMQLLGTQFASISAALGNDVSTLPDYPAEIRAPAGTLGGVSGFQITFSSGDILTPGDTIDTLVAMNPAALRAGIGDVEPGGVVITNQDEFTKHHLDKAGYQTNPLLDGSLDAYKVFLVPMTTLTRAAADGLGLPTKSADRCRNFFALGLICWLYDRPTIQTIDWIEEKFGSRPEVMDANLRAMQAGFNFGETNEMFAIHYRVDKAALRPGKYRNLTGNEALAMGLIAAARLAGKDLLYASYPITPASDVLHALAKRANFGVRTFQAEDEIAAVGAAIGAAFGGAIAATGTSGPGLALKSEAIGLAVMAELPLVVLNVQRAGPSTGMPTKTEQADLLQAMYGRSGECPVVVVAPATPADCFDMAIEAVRIAVAYMTPVLLLSDSYLANGAEPWRIPDPEGLAPILIEHPKANGEFLPYGRDSRLVRPWAVPGAPGLEHRIGGLEKEHLTGQVSNDPENHQRMAQIRRDKVANVVAEIPDVEVNGQPSGPLLVLGWGSTRGAITAAVRVLRDQGHLVASAHLRYLNPMPGNLGDVLHAFQRVLIPELNAGQLLGLIRDRHLVDAVGLNKIQGRPFLVREIVDAVRNVLHKEQP